VTLTATITPTAAAGTVQFKDGTADLGNRPVSNGTASISTSMLAVGSHQLTAVFTPTNPAAYARSTSPAVTVVVTAPTAAATGPQMISPRETILTQSTGSMDLLPLPKVDFAAKLTDAATGEPVVARRIDFYGGGQELCQAPTDRYGCARCSAAENFGTQTANEIVAGYDAVFSGDREYDSSQQHASATIGTNHSKP
jgi:Bacterial Ig-like domain (group 3)